MVLLSATSNSQRGLAAAPDITDLPPKAWFDSQGDRWKERADMIRAIRTQIQTLPRSDSASLLEMELRDFENQLEKLRTAFSEFFDTYIGHPKPTSINAMDSRHFQGEYSRLLQTFSSLSENAWAMRDQFKAHVLDAKHFTTDHNALTDVVERSDFASIHLTHGIGTTPYWQFEDDMTNRLRALVIATSLAQGKPAAGQHTTSSTTLSTIRQTPGSTVVPPGLDLLSPASDTDLPRIPEMIEWMRALIPESDATNIANQLSHRINTLAATTSLVDSSGALQDYLRGVASLPPAWQASVFSHLGRQFFGRTDGKLDAILRAESLSPRALLGDLLAMLAALPVNQQAGPIRIWAREIQRQVRRSDHGQAVSQLLDEWIVTLSPHGQSAAADGRSDSYR